MKYKVEDYMAFSTSRVMYKKDKGYPVNRNLQIGKTFIWFHVFLEIETDKVKNQYAKGDNEYGYYRQIYSQTKFGKFRCDKYTNHNDPAKVYKSWKTFNELFFQWGFFLCMSIVWHGGQY